MGDDYHGASVADSGVGVGWGVGRDGEQTKVFRFFLDHLLLCLGEAVVLDEDRCDGGACVFIADTFEMIIKFTFSKKRVHIFGQIPRAGVWLYAFLGHIAYPYSGLLCVQLG